MKAATPNNHGLTLVEIIVSTLVVSIAILAIVKTFPGVQESIHFSKVLTLGTNLGQEKMQILKQKTFYNVIVSTYTQTCCTGLSPTFSYDAGYYPPETVLEGGIQFTRYTLVQIVTENSGVLQTLVPTSADTGMKLITVSVVWQSGSDTKVTHLNSILTNPNTVMMVSRLYGQVRNAVTSAGISNAVVNIAENVGWRDNTDASGNYNLYMTSGTYNVVAVADGYYDRLISLSMPPNSAQNLTISMSPMSTGTVSGYVWLNQHLLITQVVASTGPANGIEYIELYNPTTSAILIGSNATVNTPNIWPILWDAGNNGKARHLYYTAAGNSSVPSYGYYLISNTGNVSPATSCASFTIGGVTKTPDACWQYVIAPNHAIECAATPCPTAGNPWDISLSPDAGGVSLGNSASVVANNVDMSNWPGNRIDSVGWRQTAVGNAAPSNAVEGTHIQAIFGGGAGLPLGEQFVRKMSTGTISGAYGRAYDANVNSTDFTEIGGISINPNTSATTQTPLTGTPATGAYISITDNLSSLATAYSIGNPPYATFSVPRVATGTWNVFFSSGGAYTQISTVTITANTTTWVPNGGSSPAGSTHTIINSNAINGYLTGRVVNIAGVPISPAITVSMGGSTALASTTNGNYFLQVPPGTYTASANPNNMNATYVSQDQSGLTILLGQVTSDVDFVLPQGGRISGRSTRDGSNALPGVTFVALNSMGIQVDQAVADASGNFMLVNMTTGTYTIQPSMDESEIASPLLSSCTVSAGATVSAGTFTITGAFGVVTGSVTISSTPVRVGALIIITTTTIVAPPSLSSSSLTGPSYYIGSSLEDGSYSISVRGSTSTVYNAYAYYSTVNGSAISMSTRTLNNISVTPGMTTSGRNFIW